MTNELVPTLVLKDAAGDYFLVPQEMLERGRVPAEHNAEVEQLLTGAGGDDVQGFADALNIAGWLLFEWAVGMIGPAGGVTIETGRLGWGLHR